MGAEQVVKPPVLTGVMMAVKILQSLHLVLIVVLIVVADVLKTAKMIVMLLQRHRLVLVVVIVVIVAALKIATRLAERDVVFHVSFNVQNLVWVAVMSLV